MKKSKLFGLALVATMTSFSACTNDAEEILTQESEIELTSEITPSRVADPELQSTHIVSGRQVGVTITGATTDHNNVAWSVGNNGALTNTGDAVYYGNGTATITAYHPFNDDWDESTTYAFSVSTDQSTNAEYLASDLLWATATSSKTETAVPLTFSHKLAKINVTLVPEKDGDDLNGATISIYGTKITTAINPTTGQMLGADGTTQEIIASVIDDDVYTASAIVVPQEVSGKFIKITHEGKTYFYTLPSTKTLEPGHSYSYTLTVKGNQLISAGASISPWNPDSEEGDAEEEEEETIPNNQIWYTSSDGNVVTPCETDGFGANIISNVYENGKGIITFDGDITSIAEIAFSAFNLNLTSIIIPNTVTSIEQAAFLGCNSLTSITISSNITNIGNQAFSGCSSLANIVVEQGNSIYDSRENCNAIIETATNTLITGCKNTIIPNSVTKIGQNAFEMCSSLTNIAIPNSVTNIEHASFSGCSSLTNIIIPNSVIEIGSEAFGECESLANIVVEQGNSIYDSRENCNAIIETATNTLITGCKNTVIPNNITKIGSKAFINCNSLTSITIPNSVTSIEFASFSGCSSLTNIIIPNSVTNIDAIAFRACSSLKRVDVKATTPPTIGVDAFKKCSNDLKIYVPSESLNTYKTADYWKDLNLLSE